MNWWEKLDKLFDPIKFKIDIMSTIAKLDDKINSKKIVMLLFLLISKLLIYTHIKNQKIELSFCLACVIKFQEDKLDKEQKMK